MRQAWLRKLRSVHANLIVAPKTRVCKLHFTDSCYERGKLKVDSIPTVFPSKVQEEKKPFRRNPLKELRKARETQVTDRDNDYKNTTDTRVHVCSTGEDIQNTSRTQLTSTNETTTDNNTKPKAITVGTQTENISLGSCKCNRPVMKEACCAAKLPDVNIELDLKNNDQMT